MIVLILNKVENIVGKGEIAHYEQFLLLAQCCHKMSAAESSDRNMGMICVHIKVYLAIYKLFLCNISTSCIRSQQIAFKKERQKYRKITVNDGLNIE